MKKTLLSMELPVYKANLHTHTTLSDGKCTPEQIKAMYLAEWYSIVAYTDHDILLDHADLCDERFLALNGYEIEVMESAHKRPFGDLLTCHICLIAKDPKNLVQIGYHKDKYIWGNALAQRDKLRFDRDDYERVYSHEGISDIFRLGREGGFFVTYNHPSWSMESYPQYSGYTGMDAMEIFNTGAYEGGWPEYNDRVYDDLLRQGKRISCIAADDTHNGVWDAFGGWVMLHAEKLDYARVIAALERGDFYASTGPEIYKIEVEDNVVHVETSQAHAIRIMTGARRCGHFGGGRDYSAHVSCADYRLLPQDGYFRVDVVDDHGRRAMSNAYWLDELK